MLYNDLRGWMQKVDEFGELRTVEGCDWKYEMGAVAEVYARNPPYSAILFDKIKDYPAGHRVLVGVHHQSLKRQCLTTHLPLDYDRNQFIQAWRQRLNNPDLYSAAGRRQRSGDGKRLRGQGHRSACRCRCRIGTKATAAATWAPPISSSPATSTKAGSTSAATASWCTTKIPWRFTFRRENRAASSGKNISIKGRPCPVAISFGDDPLLLTAAANSLPWGKSEYEYAGGIRGQAIDVVIGKHTGLPIPAFSEITIEGECYPDNQRREGPYGEWTGYYASGERTEPIIKVKRLMHRNNPILTGAPSSRPPGGSDDNLVRSAFIWDHMEKAGVPDIRGVACFQGRFFTAVSIKQRYPGHAKQAGFVAAQCGAGAYLGRYIVVVDDDIDPYDHQRCASGPCARVPIPRQRHRLHPPRLERSA